MLSKGKEGGEEEEEEEEIEEEERRRAQSPWAASLYRMVGGTPWLISAR